MKKAPPRWFPLVLASALAAPAARAQESAAPAGALSEAVQKELSAVQDMLARATTEFEGPQQSRSIVQQKITRLWPTGDDFRRAWPATLRGTALGSILGVLPGGGATLSSFAAYALEKKAAKDPSRFGRGAVEGVAGPESANNAGAQTSFIPMLTLGIPGNAVMALMIGALMIHGIQPGPQIMAERPNLFWGMVASMWIGNLMLVIINLPLIGMWVQLLKVPYRFLYLAILLFCGIGVYTVNNSAAAVLLAAFFGVAGYVFMRLECEAAPLILGFVPGPLMEENLRRAMRISGGDPMIFLNRPISLGLLIAVALSPRHRGAASDPVEARRGVSGADLIPSRRMGKFVCCRAVADKACPPRRAPSRSPHPCNAAIAMDKARRYRTIDGQRECQGGFDALRQETCPPHRDRGRRCRARHGCRRAGGDYAAWCGPIQRRPCLQQGAAQVRGARQSALRQADQFRAASQQRARAGEGLFRLHEPGNFGRLRHRVARPHVDFLQRPRRSSTLRSCFAISTIGTRCSTRTCSSQSPTKSGRRPT